jgi:hypothetical protein
LLLQLNQSSCCGVKFGVWSLGCKDYRKQQRQQPHWGPHQHLLLDSWFAADIKAKHLRRRKCLRCRTVACSFRLTLCDAHWVPVLPAATRALLLSGGVHKGPMPTCALAPVTAPPPPTHIPPRLVRAGQLQQVVLSQSLF